MNIFATTYDSFKKLIENHLFELSGYIAYTSLLSIFPFFIAVFAVASFFEQTVTMQELIQLIYSVMPNEVVVAVRPIIDDTVRHHNPGLLTAATIVILYCNNLSIEALRTGLNTAYMLKETRPLWLRLIQNFVLFVIGVSSFILASIAIIAIPVIIQYVDNHWNIPFNVILGLTITRYIIATVVITITLAMLYMWLPNHRKKIKLFPGAFAAAVLWIMFASLFSLYLENFGSYNVLYGALGGIIITLIFLNLTALIILLGAQINAIIGRRKIKDK